MGSNMAGSLGCGGQKGGPEQPDKISRQPNQRAHAGQLPTPTNCMVMHGPLRWISAGRWSDEAAAAKLAAIDGQGLGEGDELVTGDSVCGGSSGGGGKVEDKEKPKFKQK